MKNLLDKIKGFLGKVWVKIYPVLFFLFIELKDFKNWTSVRAVYLLMSLVLLGGLIYKNWWVVVFVIVMLNVGVWTKLCPSKWIFEKLGLKKMSALEGISKISRIALLIAGLIILTFFAIQTCIVVGVCEPSYFLAEVGYACVIAFIPPFFIVVREFLANKKRIQKRLKC